MKRKTKKPRLEAVKAALSVLTYAEMMEMAWQLRQWATELDFGSGMDSRDKYDFDHTSSDHWAHLANTLTTWDLA